MININYLEKIAKKNQPALLPVGISAAAIPTGRALNRAYGEALVQGNGDPADMGTYEKILNNQGYSKNIFTGNYTNAAGNSIKLVEDDDPWGPCTWSTSDGNAVIDMPANATKSPSIFAHETGHASRINQGGLEQKLERSFSGLAELASLGGSGAVVYNELQRHQELKKAKNKKEINEINNKRDKTGLYTALGTSALSGSILLPGELAASTSGAMALPEGSSIGDIAETYSGIPTYLAVSGLPLITYGAGYLARKYLNSKNKKDKRNEK